MVTGAILALGSRLRRLRMSRPILAVGLAGLMLMSAVALLGLPTPIAPSVSAHHGSSVADSAVLRAEASLARGGGPATTTSVHCGAVFAGSAACRFGSVRPAANNSTTPQAATWLDLTSTLVDSPNKRATGMMAYDPVDQYVVLFGGDNSSTLAFGDTWTFAHDTWTLLNPTTGPSPRWVAGMTWDSGDGYLLLFGGYNGVTVNVSAGMMNDTWSFLHGNWTNLTPTGPSPSPRWRVNMADDAVDGYVLLFSGTPTTGQTTSVFQDTWKWHAGAWANITKNVTGSPPGRYRATMSYDATDGYVVLFGGCTASTCSDTTTWTYHNLTWKSLSLTVHPSARVYPTMADDPGMGYVVLYGGAATTSAGPMRDTWAFVNGTWTNLSGQISVQPANRGFEMLAYDGADGYFLLFGGEQPTTATYLGDTWAYGPAILASLHPNRSAVDLGQGVSLNTSALSGSSSLTYNYTQLPSGCASANVASLACTPNATGSFPVSVTVNDSLGHLAVANSSVLVRADPAIDSFTISPSTVTAGASTVLAVSVSSGSAPYSYRYSGLPAGCSTANSASLSCTPSAGASGSYAVSVQVSDSAGFVVSQNAFLTVNPSPGISSFLALPTTLDVGSELNFSVVVSGGTGPFSYAYTGLPAGCLSQNLSRLPCSPTGPAAGSVQVTATDAFGKQAQASASYTVNPRPSIDSFGLAPRLLDVGGTLHFWVNASGGTGTLVYGLNQLPTGCAATAGPTATCTVSVPGNFTVLASVTDTLGVSVTASSTITVAPAPSVSSFVVTPAIADVGTLLNFTVVASGGTAPLTYAYAQLPPGCVGRNLPSFTCRATASGAPNPTVVVTDRFGQSATLGTILTVNAALSVTGVTASPDPVVVGNHASISVQFAGGTGPFRIAYAGLPNGCSSANQSTLACTPSQTGSFTVQVNVTDSLGSAAVGSVYFNVTSAPSSSSFLGLSATTTYLLIGVIIAAIAVLAGILLYRRSRRAPPAARPEPSNPAGESSEPAPSESAEYTEEQ